MALNKYGVLPRTGLTENLVQTGVFLEVILLSLALARRIDADSSLDLPRFGQSWAFMRDEVKTWLRQQHLPGDAVLMIGETDHEREMMAAGGLAGFITGMRYFEGTRHAV